ncbi:MAG: 4Fe-4S binding protein [Deltaproteobacteria bacterium]|nr:4Fe-4S binding protein [Deltaproteobacteria bacterium]
MKGWRATKENHRCLSGDYFITIDTDKCNGCGECVTACPAGVLEVLDDDPNDPLREEPVAVVGTNKRNKLKYECNPCKPSIGRPPLPCIEACKAGAISHSW